MMVNGEVKKGEVYLYWIGKTEAKEKNRIN